MNDKLIKVAKQMASESAKPIYPISKRIAYVVSHGQSYASNGYAIRTHAVASALNAQGFEALCFVRPGRPWELDGSSADIPPEVELDGVRYIHSRWSEVPSGKKERLERSVERFIELFRVYRPSAVLAASNYIVGLPAWVAAKRLGIPFHYEVRGFWELSRAAQDSSYEKSDDFLAERERDLFLAQQATKVFTLNQAMRDELVKRSVAGDKIKLVPNGLARQPEIKPASEALKKRLGISSKDKVVGYIGSFTTYEGLDLLIEACEQLIKQGEFVKLLLVGDDKPLTQASRGNLLSIDYPWLIQVGRVSHSELADYYALIDTVVISRKKRLVCELVPPFKIVEALAYGKRLVVSDLEPLLEYERKYAHVVAFEAGQRDSLIKAIKCVVKIPTPEPSFLKFGPSHLSPICDSLASSSKKIYCNYLLEAVVDAKDKKRWSYFNVTELVSIAIRASSYCQESSKRVIVQIRFLGQDDGEIDAISGNLKFSERYGNFTYLRVFKRGSDFGNSTVDVLIPGNASFVAVSFVNISSDPVTGFTAGLIESPVEAYENGNSHEEVFDFLYGDSSGAALDARAVLYGDVSPNVLDGSSIWLTSVANALSLSRRTILLLKDNVKNEKVISNINKNSNLVVVEPKDIGFRAPLDQKSAVEALSLIHANCHSLTALITRGVDLSYEVQKRKEFTDIFYPYLTDFYEITDHGLSLIPLKVDKLKEIVINSKSVLYQTEEIYQKIVEIVDYEVDGFWLPPSIPQQISEADFSSLENERSTIHIGYAGKIQPRWGVVELISEVEKLRKGGADVQLHIATGKLSGGGMGGAAFVQQIQSLLKKDFVKLYGVLPRSEALSLMSQMDLIWCYRDPCLEDATLELSTKLIEAVAIGKPCVVYDSQINKRFLGDDYPFLISGLSELEGVVKGFQRLQHGARSKLQLLSSNVKENYTFSSLSSRLSIKLDQDDETLLCGKKIVVSGHDLKFIYPYVSRLRRRGAKVAIDYWNWGDGVSLRLSEYYSVWADYIFCEWGLANAVWHSNNKKAGKLLFIRLHAQEVRAKAKKITQSIDPASVDSFIFVSSLIREQAIELYGWPEAKTKMIPNAVRMNRFFNSSGSISPVFGMVGIIPMSKRLDRALDLLSALNRRGWAAKLYCKGHLPEDLPFMHAPGRRHELSYYNELYERIDKDPFLRGYVFFDGWGNDVVSWYRKIDFILSPSDNESFHYALADGVMAGVLPLLWRWSGCEEVYPESWIVADESVAGIVEDYLARDDGYISNLKVRNRQFVSGEYLDEMIYDLIDQLFISTEAPQGISRVSCVEGESRE